MRYLLQVAGGGLERALRRIEVVLPSGQMPQVLQCQGSNTVTAGDGFVHQPAWPLDQGLLIVGSEIETALLFVLEMRDHLVCQRHGPLQTGTVPACLQQGQNRLDQEGMIIEIGCLVALAVLAGGQQAASRRPLCQSFF